MEHPNLLFLYTDQQRADTLAAYGNARIEMPNLNRLASRSTVFEQAYVTQPVCTPSRSSLLTGLYPHTSGMLENNVALRAGISCFPEMAPSLYATGHHGKWHLCDEVFAQHGFQDWVSAEDMYRKHFSAGRDKNARSSYHHFLIENGFKPSKGQDVFGRSETAALPEEFGKPAFLAREASRFIRENQRRPFILFVNFLEPHTPNTGPRNAQYDPAALPLPPNFNCPPGPEQHLKPQLFWRAYNDARFRGAKLQTEADWRREIARYWGLCSLVDTHAGAILKTLEDCGLMDKTIIAYTSDHGDMMGSHRLLHKCLMYEEATRVPFVIRLPGQRRQRRVAGPVSHIHVVPTLLDLMEHAIPGHLQGQSLRSAVEGSTAYGDAGGAIGQAFIEWNGSNHSLGGSDTASDFHEICHGLCSWEEAAAALSDRVRTVVAREGWKFNYSPRGDHELYNLKDDPIETRNLARNSDYRPVMRDLGDRIRRWQERTGDTVALPDL